MIDEQTIKDLVPYVWPSDKQERIQLCSELKQDFDQLLLKVPDLENLIKETMQKIAIEGPYYDLIEQFQGPETKKHKLFEVLSYLEDPQTSTFNFKQSLKPLRLQKTICDSYRIYNRRILDYQCKLLTYSQYYKTSLSTLKKSFNEMYVDYNTLNFVCAYATNHCPSLSQLWEDYDDQQEKYRMLASSLEKLKKMQKPDNLTHYFNRQQLILIYVLFSLMQCEEMLAVTLGEAKSFVQVIQPEEQSIDDYSWNLNGFSQIRDYFPKLAQKLNKRMKILKDLPSFTKQESVGIYFYAQNVLGYKRSENNISEQLKNQINDILNYRNTQSLPLILLVSNAKLYTQIMYSLL